MPNLFHHCQYFVGIRYIVQQTQIITPLISDMSHNFIS